MNETAIVIDQNFVIALILTLAGVAVYSLAPPGTTDIREKARHGVLGLVAFILLFLAQGATGGGTAIDPVSGFAYFSAGSAPNLVLDAYSTYTSAKK